ncbi:MAG: hypothetical protein ABSE49_22725 [Polyangiaceae bacterium]|jgi:hypothetical protein
MIPRVTVCAAIALLVLGPAAACNVTSATSSEDLPAPHPVGVDGGDAAAAALADAGPADQAQAPATQGSPLCNAPLTGSCYPDDLSTAKACGLAPDGGAYNASAGYDNVTLACRVVATPPDANGVAQAPACEPAGTAGDGSWCKSSDECQAGFDCVGSGTCQHYCCSGNTECGPELPQAVADEFCDIQPTTQATGIEIPVCMPIHPPGGCQLLDPSACSTTETCSVVRDDGSTSCVGIGGAKAGQPCDKEHCAASLACLGAVGSRTCYQLCDTSTAQQCSTTQQCKGGLPLFPDPTIGICQ